MIRVIRAFCSLGVLQHIPTPSSPQVPNQAVLTRQPVLCMKHANRHVSLISAIQSTYESVRLPKNCVWARSLPACGHHILFVHWMPVAGNRTRGDHQNRRLGWKIEFRLDEHWESRYNAKASGSQYARLSAVSLASRRVWTWISARSSFTAPELALAMCLRIASVISLTRVLGRWDLPVAVDTRRQRIYRLRRARSAAKPQFRSHCFSCSVKDFEDSQSTLVTTPSAEPYLFKTARRPFLSVRPLVGGEG